MTEPELLVTLDSNQLDALTIERLAAACRSSGLEARFCTVTVTARERGDAEGLEAIPESAVWGESTWGQALWSPEGEPMVLDESRLDESALGSASDTTLFERALGVVSNGSFPPAGARSSLSKGYRRLMRDAMLFEAHARARRHVLVSDDSDLSGPRNRHRLQRLGSTWIVTSTEFLARAAAGTLSELLNPPPPPTG